MLATELWSRERQEEETADEVSRRERILAKFLLRREALFNDMTAENATTFVADMGKFRGHVPRDWEPDLLLAGAHRARLQWLDVTDAMLTESLEWLTSRGYDPNCRTVPPLTPETRDQMRMFLGMKPLGGTRPH